MDQVEKDSTSIVEDVPTWLKLITSLSSTLNKIAASIAAILLVLMVALILIEIVLRFFSLSTFMTDVLVGYGAAAITFLALGWTLEQGSMIRVNAFTQRLNHRSSQIAAGFSIFSTLVLVSYLIYFEWSSVIKLFSRGRKSEHYFQIPLWIPETIFLVGLILLALQLIVLALRLIVTDQQDNKTLKL